MTTHGSALAEPQTDALFKALSSPQRREIVRMLAQAGPDAAKTCCAPGEVCACKISERLDLAPSTISHHMSLLRKAGLVTARRDGTWVYYTLQRELLHRAVEGLLDI